MENPGRVTAPKNWQMLGCREKERRPVLSELNRLGERRLVGRRMAGRSKGG